MFYFFIFRKMYDLQEPYRERLKRPENQGKSFTCGVFLYNFLRDNSRAWEHYEGVELEKFEFYLENMGFTREQIDNFSYNAILEILDISVLQEIAEDILYPEKQED